MLITGDAVITVKRELAAWSGAQKAWDLRAAVDHDVELALGAESIARLGELRPRVVAMGHGPPLQGDPFVTFSLVRWHRRQERNGAFA